MHTKSRGFSLVELITVTSIVAILTAIAIPSYRGYVLRANRADAKAGLLSAAGGLERCFTRFNAYDAAGCTVSFPVTVGDGTGTYRVSATDIQPDTFTLQAVPIGQQARDTACGTFGLNSGNQRTVSGTKPVKDCWGR